MPEIEQQKEQTKYPTRGAPVYTQYTTAGYPVSPAAGPKLTNKNTQHPTARAPASSEEAQN